MTSTPTAGGPSTHRPTRPRERRVIVPLAGADIDVRCGPGTEHLATAFLPTGATDVPDVTDVTDAPEVTGGAAPLRLSVRVDAEHLDGRVPADADGTQHLRSGGAHVWVVPTPRHLQRLDVRRDTSGAPSAELVVDPGALGDGTIRARPAVDAISAWAARRGIMPVHAAAVARDGRDGRDGHDGRAVLLVGPGGRGKTTTALTLATRGWRLIADDRCFLEATPHGTVVHGLYGTAVLTQAMVGRLGADRWESLGRTHGGKSAHRLPPDLPVARSALLGAVVTVDHDGEPYRVAPLPRPAAHAAWQEAFAPALQTDGPTPALLAAYARASRTHPVTRLTLGWDAGRIDDALAGLLEAEQAGGGLLDAGGGR